MPRRSLTGFPAPTAQPGAEVCSAAGCGFCILDMPSQGDVVQLLSAGLAPVGKHSGLFPVCLISGNNKIETQPPLGVCWEGTAVPGKIGFVPTTSVREAGWML